MRLWKISGSAWSYEDNVVNKLSIEEAIQHITKLGFDGVEFRVRDPLKEFPSERRKKLSELFASLNVDLTAIALTPYGATSPKEADREQVVQYVKSSCELAVELGTKIIGIWPNEIFPRLSPAAEYVYLIKVPYWDAWNRFVDTYTKCAEIAEDFKVTLAMEYRRDTILGNADAVLRLVDAIDSKQLGALLDISHAIYARDDVPTVIEMFQDILVHTHFGDNDGYSDLDQAVGVHHNFEPYLRALKNIGYNKYIGLDLEPVNLEDPDDWLSRSKCYIEELLNRI